jgi:hypothetical protein
MPLADCSKLLDISSFILPLNSLQGCVLLFMFLSKTVSVKEAYYLRYPHCVDGDSVASIQIVASTIKMLCGHRQLVPQLPHFLIISPPPLLPPATTFTTINGGK